MLNELHILKIMKEENCTWGEALRRKKETLDLESFF